jgi:transcriptional regulator with XRE-family HTH domain
MDKVKHKSEVALRLKSARAAKGLTQLQVQRATNINEATIGGYENGVSEPSLFNLSMLAALYEVSTDWIINGVESSKSDEFIKQLKGLINEYESK